MTGQSYPNVLDTHHGVLTTAHGVQDVSRKALANGGEVYSFNEVEWDVAGRCERPVMVHHRGPPSYNALGKVIAINRYITMHTKCRTCPSCLKDRGWHWTMRAKAELAFARRTWFATMTLTPAEQFKALSRARSRCTTRGVQYEALTSAEQFRAVVAAIAPELTMFLKRVRANSNAQLRYCLVAEPHKSGYPHFHALIHECGPTTVTERQLRYAWKYGFSKFKLVGDDEDDGKTAYYVAKYLSKSALARVRASKRYGEGWGERSEPQPKPTFSQHKKGKTLL